MFKLKTFLKNELTGWSLFETAWLLFAVTVVFGLSAYCHDTWYGFVSAVSGVICVVLTGKGKLSAYVFGIVNCTLYGYISYTQALYGETMLNLLWYLPLQFYGFAVWCKNMGECEVRRQRLNWIEIISVAVATTVCTACYGIVLAAMSDPLPYVDSFTTVASVLAMWLSCRRYAEQWYLWIAVDVLSVYMWWDRYCAGDNNIATLTMWIVFLANAVYGCVNWEKDIRRNA